MNLTTLAEVKLWLPQISNTSSDAILNSLIQRCSSQILAYLNRPDISQKTFIDNFNGIPPSGELMIKNWPVLSVSAVSVNTYSVQKSSGQGQPGWTLETWDGSLPGQPQLIGIRGYNASYQSGGYGSGSVGYDSAGLLTSTRGSVYGSGFQNVSVTYTAGYVVQAEAQTIPATPYQVTPLQPYGIWAADGGVTYTNGTALTAIASGTPTVGQYLPPQPWATSPTSVYTFAAADTAQGVLLTYSFIPFALDQGCVEWVGERFKYRHRIGLKSQSLSGQESIAYQLGMPDAVKMMIDPYAKSFPL